MDCLYKYFTLHTLHGTEVCFISLHGTCVCCILLHGTYVYFIVRNICLFYFIARNICLFYFIANSSNPGIYLIPATNRTNLSRSSNSIIPNTRHRMTIATQPVALADTLSSGMHIRLYFAEIYLIVKCTKLLSKF